MDAGTIAWLVYSALAIFSFGIVFRRIWDWLESQEAEPVILFVFMIWFMTWPALLILFAGMWVAGEVFHD